jgi:hypothetical protein
MRDIEDYQPRKIERRRGSNYFSAKAAFHQKRQPAAMIQMGMSQKHEVHSGWIKAKGLGVFLVKLPAALQQTAIDKDPPA